MYKQNALTSVPRKMVLLYPLSKLLYLPSLLHLFPSSYRFYCSSPYFSATSYKNSHPTSLLPLCQNINELKNLNTLLIVHGLLEDDALVTQLINLCFSLGTPELAINIFSTLKSPTLLLQNLIIRCLSHYGLHNQLLYLYSKCQKLGCSSDNYTFPFVIKACASSHTLRTGKETHCVALKNGFEHNVVVQTALVDMYAKTGRMSYSRVVFDKIAQPDLVSWNALLSGYSFNGLHHEALQVFQQIQLMGFAPNVSTFASFIPVCTRLGCMDIGKSIHGLTIKCGVSLDESLLPALISVYGSNGDVFIARELFDLLTSKNVVVWNAMISAYTQNRMCNEALVLYCKMVRETVQPNLVTFVSLLPSFDIYDRIQYGESVHACGIKHGLAHQLGVVTALLSMYSKLGEIDSANFLFNEMQERNILSWNSMLSGYVHNQLPYKGLVLFLEMQTSGMIPDSVSLVSVLSACTLSRESLMGMSVHAYCIRNGLDLNHNLSNALLAFYSECQKLPTSISLFLRMEIRNVVSWNTLISSCVHQGDTETAVVLLHQMQQHMKFDLVTMISILPSYCEPERLKQGLAIHGYATKIGFSSDVSFINALICMYLNCGDVSSGYLLFQGMRLRSVVSWNALLTGYRYNNLYGEVMNLFKDMMKEDQKPNYVTLLNIVPACQNHLHGKSIHAYAVRTGDILEPPLRTSLISMYARFENVNSCCVLFETADKSNITMWNAIMSVHVKSSKPKHAVASFIGVLGMQVEPDYITILTLISACVYVSSLSLSDSVMAFVIRKGFENDLAISNSFMDFYAQCGYIVIARKIFDELKIKDAISWSVMINGYGIHGDAEAALILYLDMRSSGVKPDDVMFISILSACSHAGLVQQGKMLFKSMVEEFGIIPRMEHYACMVDLLGRTGHLSEAYDIVKRLPIKPSPTLLESLIGACSIHGNSELAEEVTRWFSDVDQRSSGSYVMLSNVYAGAGRWGDASRVRSEMEEIRLKKEPGLSFVEVSKH